MSTQNESAFEAQLIQERILDQYEALWRNETCLKVEDFIKHHLSTGDFCDGTIDELIFLEIEFRHGRGDNIKMEEYLSRFPDRESAVQVGIMRLEQLGSDLTVSSQSGERSKLIPQVVKFGDVLGEFQIVRRIGSGGFGVVFQANDTTVDEMRALKFPRLSSLQTLDELKQLQNEAEIAQHLDHRAIVKSFGMRSTNGLHFVVQQFVDGCTLRDQTPNSQKETVELLIEIAEGLDHAHQFGLIHRDLKPANILIDRNGQPLVSDFGLAVHESAQRRLMGQRCGSPSYMSPEQVMGLVHRMDGRSDIWSLGIILYELLAKRRPFRGESPEEIFDEIKNTPVKPLRMISAEIDRELQRICLKCLNKSVRQRYGSCRELIEDLTYWLDHSDQWSNATPPLVIRGLRAFEARDAVAYLNLLPGQKDRFGIPDSIQFWKYRLEEPKSERFSVGVLLGPSGSGKTSFIKAGLLPQLDSSLIETVFVEATLENTEKRIAERLQAINPRFPVGLSVSQLLDGITHGAWDRDQKPILIVIDQFEQWLIQRSESGSEELVEGLKHCNGQNLFCVLTVRDDYWLEASRFMERVECDWNESENVQRIDLFELNHARHVLFEVGSSLRKLPEREDELTRGQNQFLEKVVSDLAVGERVICLHLILFAEMFRNRNWSLSELEKIGGVSGVGQIYLKETFQPEPGMEATPHLYADAKAILESLLPDSIVLMTKVAKPESVLRQSLGFSPSRFDRALNWLDEKKRLVTRVNFAAAGESEPSQTDDQDRAFCQLTHDYLVPAVRQWLTKERKLSWRGRAELKLLEATEQYSLRPTSKSLPSFVDFIQILLSNRTFYRSLDRRILMQRSAIHYSYLALIGAIFAGCLVFPVVIAMQKRADARAAFLQFMDSPSERIQEQFAALEPHGTRVAAMMGESSKSASVARRLRAKFAGVRLFGEEYLEASTKVWNEIFETDQSLLPGEFRHITRGMHLNRQTWHSLLVNRYASLTATNLNVKGDAATDDFLREQALLASFELDLGKLSIAAQLADNVSDPTSCTLFIARASELSVDPNQLLRHARSNQGNSRLLYILLIIAARLELNSSDTREAWETYCNELFQQHPDAGVHSACQYLANRHQFALSQLKPKMKPSMDRNWWLVQLSPTSTMTFSRIGSGKFLRGENASSNIVSLDLPSIGVSVNREFWMATTEVSQRIFREWLDCPEGRHLRTKLEQTNRLSRIMSQETTEHPLFGLSFLESLQFVKWLNSRIADQIGEDFQFGIPDTDQWELACRGGASTRYFWGNQKVLHLLPEYAVYQEDRTASFHHYLQPSGNRTPNPFGLFDIAGNVSEINSPPEDVRTVEPNVAFYRGGSTDYKLLCMSGASWDVDDNNIWGSNWGIRLILERKEK